MKKTTRIRALIAVLLLALLPCVQSVAASAGFSPLPKEVELTPETHPDAPGLVSIVFRFAPHDGYEGNGEFKVHATAVDGGEFMGPSEWTFTAYPDKPHEEVLAFVVAPDTVSGLVLSIMGKGIISNPAAFFVHHEDSVEFWRGYPSLPGRTPKQATEPDDSLDFRFTIPSEEKLTEVLRILGELPDSTVGKTVITRGTLKQVHLITLLGIKPERLDVPSGDDPDSVKGGLWIPTKEQPSDADRDSGPQGRLSPLRDSSLQGALEGRQSLAGTEVTIDTVVPMILDSTILMDDSVEIRFKFTNNDGIYYIGVTNGFEIYSTTNAVWSVVDTTIRPSLLSWFDNKFYNHFGSGSPGADTAGFGAFVINSAYLGVPPGADVWVYSVMLDLSDLTNEGRSICIDSAFYRPGGEWLWAKSGGGSEKPEWTGPHCYSLSDGKVNVEGKLEFTDFSDTLLPRQPMANVTVVVWDSDIFGADDSLGYFVTNSDGTFSSDRYANVDADEYYTNLDIYLEIKCIDSSVARITDDSLSSTPFSFVTPVSFEVGFGTHMSNYTVTSDDTGKYFFVLSAMQSAKAVAQNYPSLSLGNVDGSHLKVVVQSMTTNTSAYELSPGLYVVQVQDSIDQALLWPQTWQKPVLAHEYGHIISLHEDFCDSRGGDTAGAHHWYDSSSLDLAGAEGFACLFGAMVENDTGVIFTRYNNNRDYHFQNLETGQMGQGGATFYDTIPWVVNCYGPWCEGTVACLWWDLIDGPAGLEEFSDSLQWGNDPATVTASSDGVGDAIAVSTSDMFVALTTDHEVTGNRPDNISEFMSNFLRTTYTATPEFHQALFEHGIVWGCCRGIRANVDGDSDERINIVDLTYFVDYLFQFGSAPPCSEEADFNADGYVNIIDLTSLSSVLFMGGSAPRSCAD